MNTATTNGQTKRNTNMMVEVVIDGTVLFEGVIEYVTPDFHYGIRQANGGLDEVATRHCRAKR